MTETIYRVRARNTSADSENRIHSDDVAARYGFRGGLVPGVTVYGYMTVPVVAEFGREWLERGSIQVKFHQPFYEGDVVEVRAEVDRDAEPVRLSVVAAREDGAACATGLATVDDDASWLGEMRLEDYPQSPLTEASRLPVGSRENFIIGARLGTISERLELADESLLESLDERLPIYRGCEAVAHPMKLLGLANQILMQNFKLGPWIHVASDLINRSAARNGDTVSVRGRIRDLYERKGHEFVVLDLLVVADEDRIVQQVRHTAIYSPRMKSD